MNEASDVASNLPAILLLSFWWAFLSMLDVLSKPADPPHGPGSGRRADEAREAEDELDFPQLREVDPDFRAAAFLQGACRAYEEILHAYASYDAKRLGAFLSAEVFRAFDDAFEARSARGETLELALVGIQSAGIAGVEIRSDAIEIAVLFRAQIIQAERSRAGEVIRGDRAEIANVADLWTFSRPRAAGATNWIVVATGGPAEAA